MLREDAKLFLIYNFQFEGDDADDLRQRMARLGRPAIEHAIGAFATCYTDLTPQCDAVLANIADNHEEAVQLAAGLLGMC